MSDSPDVYSRPLSLVKETEPAGTAGRGLTNRRFWLGLVWSEWFSHARLILAFLILWMVVIWVLPKFAHPLWILGLGGLVAVILGPALGGSDVMGGCEEFSFSQPATRHQRFDARLFVGLGCVLVFTVMNLIALLPVIADLILSFFVSTGIAPVELRHPEFLYGVVLAVPTAAFTVGFSVAALSTTRAVAYTAWVWGALSALTGLRAGLSLEDFFWDRLNGRVTVPLLLVMAGVTVAITRRLYSEKEAGRASSPLRLPMSGWAVLGAAALGALGVGLLIAWFVANYARTV